VFAVGSLRISCTLIGSQLLTAQLGYHTQSSTLHCNPCNIMTLSWQWSNVLTACSLPVDFYTLWFHSNSWL